MVALLPALFVGSVPGSDSDEVIADAKPGDGSTPGCVGRVSHVAEGGCGTGNGDCCPERHPV
jgi:hypothetical protein